MGLLNIAAIKIPLHCGIAQLNYIILYYSIGVLEPVLVLCF